MRLFILILGIFIKQETFTISSIFANKNYIPPNYTCSGNNVNPEFRIKGIPAHTQSMAFIVEDPDPAFGTFDHWVMWNIPPTSKIAENSAPGIVGRNSRKENKYTGPCPPNGVHEYHFKMYALDIQLNLPDTAGKYSLMKAMNGHILGTAELLGRYSK